MDGGVAQAKSAGRQADAVCRTGCGDPSDPKIGTGPRGKTCQLSITWVCRSPRPRSNPSSRTFAAARKVACCGRFLLLNGLDCNGKSARTTMVWGCQSSLPRRWRSSWAAESWPKVSYAYTVIAVGQTSSWRFLARPAAFARAAMEKG